MGVHGGSFTAVGTGVVLALLGAFFNEGDLSSAWLFAGFVLLAPVFAPLARDGRTTCPKGTRGPFMGDLRRAWEVFPVEPSGRSM